MLLASLAYAVVLQGTEPPVLKPGMKIPNVKLPPTIAWMPPFAPSLPMAEQPKWRAGCLAALTTPKVYNGMPIVAITAKKVMDELAKQGIDPAAQKSTWDTDQLLKIGAKLKTKYIGQIDLFPIQPNLGVNKELVAVTGTVSVYELATKKPLLQNEKFYVTGDLPSPGKGTQSDGYATAVHLCETVVPSALKFAYLKATGQMK